MTHILQQNINHKVQVLDYTWLINLLMKECMEKIEAHNVEFQYENELYRGAEFVITLK